MSTCNRLDKFKQDCAEAISICDKYQWSFIEFVQSGNALSFKWDRLKDCCFTLCASEEDYPENSLLTEVIQGKENTSLYDRPVQYILVKLRDELLHRYKEKMEPPKKAKVDEATKPTTASTQQSYDRSVSMESTHSSVYMSAESDDDEYDMDLDMEGYYYTDMQQQEEELDSTPQDKINSLLTCDMEQVKLLYGDKSIAFRLLEGICEVDVELHIPLFFLNDEVAQAWKFNRNEPLIVRLHLSSLHYLDAKDPPKVEVLQPSRREKFGVGSQLRKILENFLVDEWRSLNNKHLEQASAPKSFSVPSSLAFLSTGTQDKNEGSTDSTKDEPDPFKVDSASVAKIIEMGFSADVARNALIITRGNVEEALSLLLNNPESCSDVDVQEQMLLKKKPVPCRQYSYPGQFQKKSAKRRHIYNKQKSIPSSSTSPSLSNPPVEDLSLLPSTTLTGKNSKQVPSLCDGFLVQIFRYTRQRIPTLNEYCVVCDEPHVFQNGAMLKPAVCSRELCVFAFQTLGVMLDAADDIATGAEVVVLLLAMTRAACRSARKNVIFEPYPTVVDPVNSQELAFSPKSKDYAKVAKVLELFPSIQEMMGMGSADLKKELDLRQVLAYPLLQWIIASNRSHIVKLPGDRQLSFMHTSHQFLLMSSPPAKEAKFREEKLKYGSTFAFHGSSIENWHSIIREGLIVASGTNKQLNGAAYGKGIYLSPTSSVSFGYSRMGYGYYDKQNKQQDSGQSKSRFLTSDNISCIALCEVVTSPSLKKSNNIWVCPVMEHVSTRFFFVYEDGQVGDNNIDTQQEKYRTEIMRAVGYRNA